MTYRIFILVWVIVAAVGYAAGAAIAIHQRDTIAAIRAAEAQCMTDSECAELCPADDTECDGGPQ